MNDEELGAGLDDTSADGAPAPTHRARVLAWLEARDVTANGCALTAEVSHSVLYSEVLNNDTARWPTAPKDVRGAKSVRQSFSQTDLHHQIAGIGVTAWRSSQIGAPIKPLG